MFDTILAISALTIAVLPITLSLGKLMASVSTLVNRKAAVRMWEADILREKLGQERNTSLLHYDLCIDQRTKLLEQKENRRVCQSCANFCESEEGTNDEN
jgi:hypothetical protein